MMTTQKNGGDNNVPTDDVKVKLLMGTGIRGKSYVKGDVVVVNRDDYLLLSRMKRVELDTEKPVPKKVKQKKDK